MIKKNRIITEKQNSNQLKGGYMRNLSLLKYGLALGLSVLTTTAFAADPCTDAMGHTGSGTNVSGNKTGSISGTPWGFEQWYQGGSGSMTYYSNGTFKANWSGSSDYLTRVGYRYGDGGSGVDHKTKKYAVDYKYTKTGSASYGYIGIYGWTAQSKVEYYIVDDWFSKPSTQYIGDQFGTLSVDGGTYTIHAYLRQQEPSKAGTSTFVQFFSVRNSPRQCGHIDISAHFKKWDELFTGQTANLKGSKGGGSATLKLNNLTEVMLMCEAGGNASGSVDYTYFNMTDNGTTGVQQKAFSATTGAMVVTNVANRTLNISGLKNVTSIGLTSMNGKLVQQTEKITNGTAAMDVSSIKRGSYLLSARGNDGSVSTSQVVLMK